MHKTLFSSRKFILWLLLTIAIINSFFINNKIHAKSSDTSHHTQIVHGTAHECKHDCPHPVHYPVHFSKRSLLGKLGKWRDNTLGKWRDNRREKQQHKHLIHQDKMNSAHKKIKIKNK